MRQLTFIAGLVVLAIGATPSPAAADWLLTPYIGGTLLDITDTGTRLVGGGSISWMGPVAGFELDLGNAPAFLESKTGQAIDDSNLLTFMGNVVVPFPTTSSRIRPYAVGGLGLVHTKVTMPGNTLEIDDENFGFDLGGGLTAFLNEHVGLRGDFRYFRAIRNDDASAEADAVGISELKFLRGTFGVTFKF